MGFSSGQSLRPLHPHVQDLAMMATSGLFTSMGSNAPLDGDWQESSLLTVSVVIIAT